MPKQYDVIKAPKSLLYNFIKAAAEQTNLAEILNVDSLWSLRDFPVPCNRSPNIQNMTYTLSGH